MAGGRKPVRKGRRKFILFYGRLLSVRPSDGEVRFIDAAGLDVAGAEAFAAAEAEKGFVILRRAETRGAKRKDPGLLSARAEFEGSDPEFIRAHRGAKTNKQVRLFAERLRRARKAR